MRSVKNRVVFVFAAASLVNKVPVVSGARFFSPGIVERNIPTELCSRRENKRGSVWTAPLKTARGKSVVIARSCLVLSRCLVPSRLPASSTSSWSSVPTASTQTS